MSILKPYLDEYDEILQRYFGTNNNLAINHRELFYKIWSYAPIDTCHLVELSNIQLVYLAKILEIIAANQSDFIDLSEISPITYVENHIKITLEKIKNDRKILSRESIGSIPPDPIQQSILRQIEILEETVISLRRQL